MIRSLFAICILFAFLAQVLGGALNGDNLIVPNRFPIDQGNVRRLEIEKDEEEFKFPTFAPTKSPRFFSTNSARSNSNGLSDYFDSFGSTPQRSNYQSHGNSVSAFFRSGAESAHYLTMVSGESNGAVSKMSVSTLISGARGISMNFQESQAVSSYCYNSFGSTPWSTRSHRQSYMTTESPTVQPSSKSPTGVPTVAPTTESPTAFPTSSYAEQWNTKYQEVSSIPKDGEEHLLFNSMEFVNNDGENYIASDGSSEKYEYFISQLTGLNSDASKYPLSVSYSVYSSLAQSYPYVVTCYNTDLSKEIVNALILTEENTVNRISCGEELNFVINKCEGEQVASLCVNCDDPCDLEMKCNYFNPYLTRPFKTPEEQSCLGSNQDIAGSGMIRFLDFVFRPPRPPPMFKASDIDPERTSLTISGLMDGPGMIYLLALGDLSPSPSKDDFKAPPINVSLDTESGEYMLLPVAIEDLQPATQYLLYYYSVSLTGEKSEVALFASSETLCCRHVNVELLLTSIYRSTSAKDAIAVSLDAPATSTALYVMVLLDGRELDPSDLKFDPIEKNTTGFISIPASATGEFSKKTLTITVMFFGDEKDLYGAIFIGQSTLQILDYPTEVPTVRPSESFSAEPTNVGDTNPPIYLPTIAPSASPSVAPTHVPTIEPTDRPVVSPTRRPTAGPTEKPSIQPVEEGKATQSPTPAPTSNYQVEWTSKFNGVVKGLNVPNHFYFNWMEYVGNNGEKNMPEGTSSQYASFINSGLYIANFLNEPKTFSYLVFNALDQLDPDTADCYDPDKSKLILNALLKNEYKQVNCGDHSFVVDKCGDDNLPSICVDCVDPCNMDFKCSYENPYFTRPLKNIFDQDCLGVEAKVGDGLIRTIDFAFTPPPPAPSFVDISTDVQRTTISVNAILDGPGSLICGAFPPGNANAPTSYSDILAKKSSGDIYKTNNIYSGIVHVNNLQPATDYALYCYSVSLKGINMDFDLIQMVPSVTSLYRHVNVKLSLASMFQSTSRSNAIAVSLDAPATSAVLTVKVFLGDKELVPSHLVFDPVLRNTMGHISIPSSATGELSDGMEVTVELSGDNSALYQTVFTGPSTLLILDPDVEPPAPKVTTVAFSDSATQLLISFDSSTNMGRMGNSPFVCQEFFEFPNSNFAKCQWTTSSSVVAQLGPDAKVLIGNIFLLKSGKIGAAGWKVGWGYNTASTSLVSASTVPLTPSVVLIAPQLIGVCDTFYLDLAQSTGNGGREWKAIVFDVSGPNSTIAQRFKNFLNTPGNYRISPPTKLKGSEFGGADALYTLVVRLTNFLDVTSSASVNLLITSAIVPSTTIAGSSFIEMTTKSTLFLKSDSFVSVCDTTQDPIVYSTSRANVEVNRWELVKNGVGGQFFDNEAKSPSNLKLAPYVLSVGSTYTLSISSIYTTNSKTSSAFVTVLVIPGHIDALISGSSTRGVKPNELIALSAAESINEDVIGVTGAEAGLSFLWTCGEVYPLLSEDCPFELRSSSRGQEVEFYANPANAIGKRGSVSVVVYDATRSSTVSVLVITLEASAPVTDMKSEFLGKVNADKQLVIEGYVDHIAPGVAQWSCDGIDISELASSNVNFNYPAGPAAFSNFLVIKPNTLPENSVLTFTFQATNSGDGPSSFSKVSVTINSPPRPGLFYSDPSQGTELTTVFTLAASNWDDEDLPLTYAFGFLEAGIVQVVQSRSSSPFGYTLLAAGKDTDGYKVGIQCIIYDFYSALAISTNDAVVNLADSNAKNDLINDSISKAQSPDEVRQAVSVSSSSLNNVPCIDATEAFCNERNRQECLVVANTCGSCKDGYVGTIGDSNSECISLDARRRLVDEIPAQNCNSCDKGVCKLLSLADNQPVAACLITDVTCYPVCVCQEAYFGTSCDMTSEEYNVAMNTKKGLLSAFQTVIENDEVTSETVSSWAASYKSLMSDKDAIPFDAEGVRWEEIGHAILLYSGDVQLVPSVLIDTVMPSIDNGVAVLSKSMIDLDFQLEKVDPPLNADYSSQVGPYEPIVNTVDLCINSFANQAARQLVPGEDPKEFLFRNIRVVVSNAVNGPFSMRTPLTANEEASNVTRQGIVVVGRAEGFAAISVMRSLSPSYDFARGYDSNPVTLHVQPDVCGNSGQCDLSLRLETDEEMSYIPPPTVNISTSLYCLEAGDILKPTIEECPLSVPTYECVDGYTSVELFCPYETTVPVCANTLSSDDCVTTFYDSGETRCDCSTALASMSSGADNFHSITFFSATKKYHIEPAANPVYQEYKKLKYSLAFTLDIVGDITSGPDAKAFLDAVAETCGLDTSLPDVFVSFNETGDNPEEIFTRRQLSQILNVYVQFSTLSYPTANLVTMYNTMTTTLLSSVSSGAFSVLVLSNCNGACVTIPSTSNWLASVSASPPSINGAVPTFSPTTGPVKKDDSAKFDAIWAVFGSLLGIYFLMLVYAASRRYIRRLEGKDNKYVDTSGVNNNLSSEPVVEDEALRQLNNLKLKHSSEFKSRKITSSEPDASEIVDDKDLDLQLQSM